MNFATLLTALAGLVAAEPTRADRLKAVQADYAKARDALVAAVRAGQEKPGGADGTQTWADFGRRFAKPVRTIIDADPADAVALDAVLFSLTDLGQGGADPALYDLLLTHHAASPKIRAVIPYGPPDAFLRAAAEKSPHPEVKAFATYHLAENAYRTGRPDEAKELLDRVVGTKEWADIGGYGSGTLPDTAKRLRFEIDHLSVGRTAPAAAGTDLDGKPIALADYRGKVTLVVFWATWCGPCMAMVPHERALAERYVGRPFALVGVNGDILPLGDGLSVTGADGKPIDDTERVKAAVEKHRITWRSFRSGQFGLASQWNVRAWPTIYLLDPQGVVLSKWRGDPGEKELDAAVEKAVATAEKAARPSK